MLPPRGLLLVGGRERRQCVIGRRVGDLGDRFPRGRILDGEGSRPGGVDPLAAYEEPLWNALHDRSLT